MTLSVNRDCSQSTKVVVKVLKSQSKYKSHNQSPAITVKVKVLQSQLKPKYHSHS